jgi:hypothetical protein
MLSIFCKLSSAGSIAAAVSVGAGDRRRPATLGLCDLAVAFFFRDRFVFDFLAPALELFVVFLFALAMTIDPTFKSARCSLLLANFSMRR